jgi:6-pyruvoyltetrahydropterin/6-carboxytetrahydropterin synthase
MSGDAEFAESMMKVRLTKEFRFEASHRLAHLPEDHPCYRLHGHGYRVEIEVYGEVDPETGFLLDYGDLKKIVQPVIAQLDHHHLNDIDGIQTTSAEHIVFWLWQAIKPKLPLLSRIVLHETGSTSCEYRGE